MGAYAGQALLQVQGVRGKWGVLKDQLGFSALAGLAYAPLVITDFSPST